MRVKLKSIFDVYLTGSSDVRLNVFNTCECYFSSDVFLRKRMRCFMLLLLPPTLYIQNVA